MWEDKGHFSASMVQVDFHIKECVSFPFTIGPMEIMPLSKPYDHNGQLDIKSLQLHHKQTYGSREILSERQQLNSMNIFSKPC